MQWGSCHSGRPHGHIERHILCRGCVPVGGKWTEILDVGRNHRCAGIKQVTASCPRDREAEDERDHESEHDSDVGEPPKTTDLHPIGAKIVDRSSDSPGAGLFGREANLPRRIRFEALNALVLAHECDDSIHIALCQTRHGRHVAEVPMVCGHTIEDCVHV